MAKTNFKRRRRRSGSSSHRFTPAEAVRAARIRHSIGAMEILGAVVTVLVAVVVIILVWVVTNRSIQDQREQARDLAQRNLSGQATIMARSVGHELQVIEQSLTVLQQAWNKDSGLFDINRWKAEMPALMSVTDDFFVADEKRIIRQDILPQAVGQGIASAYVSWPHGALEKLGEAAPRDGVPQGSDQSRPTADARRFIMYIVRPLERPPGWLIGASYRTEEPAKLYNVAWFGTNSMAGIVDMQNGGLQTIIGPPARRSERSPAKTGLYTAMTRSADGTWTGVSPIDGVKRLHAFTHVPERDMAILVGAAETDAMAPAELFATGARGVAIGATGTVVVVAGIIAWAFYRYRLTRRRESVRGREAIELERLRQDEARLAERVQVQSARLRSLLENASDGVALIDAQLRLAHWNPRFEQGIGLPIEENMPLDALLRGQAAVGLFDAIPDDMEVEIARRMLVLRSGNGLLPQLAAGQEERALRGVPLDDGGLILLLTGAAGLPPQPPALTSDASAEVLPTAAPVEW